MSFLQHKVAIPPPAPAPPPPTPVQPVVQPVVQPEDVIRPDDVVKSPSMQAEARRKNKKRATPKTSVKTGPQGVMTDAPLQYSTLLGSNKRTKSAGG